MSLNRTNYFKPTRYGGDRLFFLVFFFSHNLTRQYRFIDFLMSLHLYNTFVVYIQWCLLSVHGDRSRIKIIIFPTVPANVVPRNVLTAAVLLSVPIRIVFFNANEYISYSCEYSFFPPPPLPGFAVFIQAYLL